MDKDERIEQLEVQLAERTKERDEAREREGCVSFTNGNWTPLGEHIVRLEKERDEARSALAQAQTDALEKAATIALTTARRADIVSLQLQHLPDRNAIAYAYATGAEHMASDIAEAIRQAMQDTGTADRSVERNSRTGR